jgi:hypothetical protein
LIQEEIKRRLNDQSRRIIWAENVARMRAKMKAYRLLVGAREKETTRKSKT